MLLCSIVVRASDYVLWYIEISIAKFYHCMNIQIRNNRNPLPNIRNNRNPRPSIRNNRSLFSLLTRDCSTTALIMLAITSWTMSKISWVITRWPAVLIATFNEHGSLHVCTFDGGSSSVRFDFLFWLTLPGISCINLKLTKNWFY